MANIDKLFISKIIQEQDFLEVADVPSYLFLADEYKTAFEYIREYFGEHGQCPTERVFKMDCTVPLIQVVVEPWSDLKERLVDQYKKSKLTQAIDEALAKQSNRDTDGAIRILSSAVADIHTYTPSSRDVDVTANGDERLERYIERKENPGFLVGIPTGIPSIDRATQGLQKGQLVTITGLPKSSKSTLALVIAMSVQEHGKKVLYLTYEQTVEEQERRLDAYRAGFNDNLLNSGMYTSDQFADLKRAVHKTENLPPLLISQDCMTVGEIAAKIDTFHPDIVIVDGVYMMEDEKGEKTGSPAALTNIVSSLKKIAMRRMISVIAVTQSTPARTKGEELNYDSIMGSRSFIQWSNTIIGIERTADTEVRKMKILLSRSCAPCEIMLVFDYDSGTFEEWENYSVDMEDNVDDDQQTLAFF